MSKLWMFRSKSLMIVISAFAVLGLLVPVYSSATAASGLRAGSGAPARAIHLDFSPPRYPSVVGKYRPLAPRSSVTVGVFPVFDESLWWVANQLGYLRDINVNLNAVKTFNGDPNVIEATAVGGVDLGGAAELGVIPLRPTLKNIRFVLFGDVWKGFAFMIRPHGMKTYKEMLQQVHNPTQAAKMTAAQMKGKTLVAALGIGHDPVIDAALKLGGLTRKDIHIKDMPTIEGATAFLRGEGDIYLGDLPSRFRLESAGNVPMLEAPQIGQIAVAYVGFVARNDWVQRNHNEVLRLLGAWFRVADLLQSPRANAGLNIMRDKINGLTGAKFTLKATQWVNTTISPWFTFEQEARQAYTPGGKWDLNARFRWGIQETISEGHLKPGQVSVSSLVLAGTLFRKLQSLKNHTQRQLSTAAALYNAGKARNPSLTLSLVNQAMWNWRIRDYVDSATLADRAVRAAR